MAPFQEYPKWVTAGDGRRLVVESRAEEEHVTGRATSPAPQVPGSPPPANIPVLVPPFSLKMLEGQLLRHAQETSDERDERGMHVFRESGEPRMWSPKPVRDYFVPVSQLSEAHGIRFLCPKSYAKNGGPKGTHSVYVWFQGSPVPPHIGRNAAGQPVRWSASGTSIDDLVLSPSILEQDDDCPAEWRCGWHGFIGTSGAPPGHAI